MPGSNERATWKGAVMFVTLLLVTLGVAVACSFTVVKVFDRSINTILSRIVADEVASAWARYLKFAIYVGVSGGVRIWELEKYITPQDVEADAIVLTGSRWTLEIYRTIIETLQSVAWMLLIFFLFALIAYVIARGRETAQSGRRGPGQGGSS